MGLSGVRALGGAHPALRAAGTRPGRTTHSGPASISCLVYDGDSGSFRDTDVTPRATYHYTVFARAERGPWTMWARRTVRTARPRLDLAARGRGALAGLAGAPPPTLAGRPSRRPPAGAAARRRDRRGPPYRYTPAVPIVTYKDKAPRFGENVFVDPTAVIIGDVELLDYANVWPGAVLRGDTERITLGRETSFQDNSVAHRPRLPHLRRRSLRDRPRRGAARRHRERRLSHRHGEHAAGRAAIGDHSIVGANSLVTQGEEVPAAQPHHGFAGDAGPRAHRRRPGDADRASRELQAAVDGVHRARARHQAAAGLSGSRPPER